MAERAAHLVDHVLPDVPLRQWVLSLPHRLRYVLAWDHHLCRTVAGVYVRAVLGFLRARARRAGLADGRSGAVVMIQRFGGALNLNVHLHALVIDGVFERDGARLVFHPAGRLTREDVAATVAVAVRRIWRLLERRGLTATSEERSAADTWAEDAPVLAGLAAASVDGRIALGPRRGAGVARYGEPPEAVAPVTLGPCYAARGFDLHAGVVVRAGKLERLCRYTRAPWRAAVVASAGSEWSGAPAGVVAEEGAGSGSRRGDGDLWAELMRRTFGIDVLECPRCGGRLRLMALIEHPQIVDRILRHLGLPTDRPEPRPPRAPPAR